MGARPAQPPEGAARDEGAAQPTTPQVVATAPLNANFMPPPAAVEERKTKYLSSILGVFIYAGVKMPETQAFEQVTGISPRENVSVSLGITAADEEELIKNMRVDGGPVKLGVKARLRLALRIARN